MSSTIKTIHHAGSNGIIVDVECQLSNGLPGITIVGLGSKAIDEARERVKSAFASTKLAMPRKRITINLAPADIPKESTSLDLAIALAIVQANKQLRPNNQLDASIIIGELGLEGNVRAVRGIIGKILAGQKNGFRRFLIPVANLAQARLVPNVELVPVKTLQELVLSIYEDKPLPKVDSNAEQAVPTSQVDYPHLLSEIVGQRRAKRGLEIAAAGGHNIFLNGPPGTGKSMLARALPSILPPLKRQEALEITQLHSLVSGNYDDLVDTRPFRTPHHSASHVAIVGGGNNLRPGEISLAHRGVLFLDELPEFNRSTIEALRQPLEDRKVTVARAKDTTDYPADFILVATANPCPCGFFGTNRDCTCPAHAVLRYRQKLSGPIMDRIDLYVDVEEVDHAKLLSASDTQEDASVRERILKARKTQAARYQSETKLNADMTNTDIKNKGKITEEASQILNNAADTLGISARGYMRIVKIARTIADLDDSADITSAHITEALQYRRPNVQNLI